MPAITFDKCRIYGTIAVAAIIAVLLIFSTNGLPRIRNKAFDHLRPPPPPNPPSHEYDGDEASKHREWVFDYRRDGKNYGLSRSQCQTAFPLLYTEIERAVEYRQKVGAIQEGEVEVGWRGDGIVRAMVRDNELYIIDAHGVTDNNHRPRSLATLHSINRAVSAYQFSLPDVEFTVTDHDSALIDPKGNHTTWAYSRLADQESLWLMPDFGFWGWPNVGMRSYSELQTILEHEDDDFLDKVPKLVWRGALAVAGRDMRVALLKESQDQAWSDVKTIVWSNETDIKENLISMEDHCAYMFAAHTEGNTYSGRLKYLLNCNSVVLSHELKWIEHYHHLLSSAGTSQNYVKLHRDFSDLKKTMTRLLQPSSLQDEGRNIADNARRMFRERYLSPAAEACYWRALIRGWASVQGFQPRAWVEEEQEDWRVDSGGKKIKRKPRGMPFQSYAIMEATEWEVHAKGRHVCIDE